MLAVTVGNGAGTLRTVGWTPCRQTSSRGWSLSTFCEWRKNTAFFSISFVLHMFVKYGCCSVCIFLLSGSYVWPAGGRCMSCAISMYPSLSRRKGRIPMLGCVSQSTRNARKLGPTCTGWSQYIWSSIHVQWRQPHSTRLHDAIFFGETLFGEHVKNRYF